MKKKKKKTPAIFDSIRKPVAPPSHKIVNDRPEEKARPARRKAKHKKAEDFDD